MKRLYVYHEVPFPSSMAIKEQRRKTVKRLNEERSTILLTHSTPCVMCDKNLIHSYSMVVINIVVNVVHDFDHSKNILFFLLHLYLQRKKNLFCAFSSEISSQCRVFFFEWIVNSGNKSHCNSFQSKNIDICITDVSIISARKFM